MRGRGESGARARGEDERGRDRDRRPDSFANLIAEARQQASFEGIPDSSRPVGVRGVGNDHTHGGVGAYWTRYRSQLTAIDERTLIKIGFHVPGADHDASRVAATELARAIFARLR